MEQTFASLAAPFLRDVGDEGDTAVSLVSFDASLLMQVMKT
jgi:hypothetical protein